MDGSAQAGADPTLMRPEEIAARIKELVEQGGYPGGTVLGVYKAGEATVVADGSRSLLEELAPSDLGSLRGVFARDRT